MFTLNNKNVKQDVGIELTFSLEIKIQNQHFPEEITDFWASETSISNPC